LVKPNTSEELKHLHPLHQSTLNYFENVIPFSIDQFWDEASQCVLPIRDCHVALESEFPQVKFMNDNFKMSCDEYSEIFNGLLEVGNIFHPIRVSPISFSNLYMFKNCGTLSIVSFLKLNGCNKL